MQSLVQPLFDGPIDVVGDVHGELDALLDLLRHLGYDEHGLHPEGRRISFLGDLTDRGPDSPGVVALVHSLIESGRAQCVLGNHDLNILLGRRKYDNAWYFGEEFRQDGFLVPQALADQGIRDKVNALFGTLPLALERGDVRVVHACWHPSMIETARTETSVAEFCEKQRHLIEDDQKSRPNLDECDRNLERQNRNPVKVLTSGLERRSAKPFLAGGKMRLEERVDWWEDYGDPQMCIFGHYWATLTNRYRHGAAYCIDFSVGKRWVERRDGGPPFKTKLAAFRLPEVMLVFDNGKSEDLRNIFGREH